MTRDDVDRVIWALKYDKAFLTKEDRWAISDMLEHNKEENLPRESFSYFKIYQKQKLEEAV